MNLAGLKRDIPGYLAVIASTALAGRIDSILATGGWRQLPSVNGLSADIDVIVFDQHVKGAELNTLLTSLLPRLALSSVDLATDCDEIVTTLQTDAEILAQVDRWRPTPDAARFAEVARGFGEAAVRPIARGLSQQLQQAITNLDASNFSTAHRIAGLAGTLGFTRTSRAWLAIDEGDFSDAPAARREARLAVVAIERWLAATESARDSAE